jgi:serine/threonine-protein kinase ULK4
MHRLHSPHTVKFHDWYETKNNLWLILGAYFAHSIELVGTACAINFENWCTEYCTGGTMASLLKQQHKFTDTSIRAFGLDILEALKVRTYARCLSENLQASLLFLQYMHSNGILVGGLRPEGIMIDEFGILKVSDFAHARTIPKHSLRDTPVSVCLIHTQVCTRTVHE